MEKKYQKEKSQLSQRSKEIIKIIQEENPLLTDILIRATSESEVNTGIRNWVENELSKNLDAYNFYKKIEKGRKAFEKLTWKDIGTIRILDYIDNAGRSYVDLNIKEVNRKNTPFKMLWQAVKHNSGEGRYYYFKDMLELFRQFTGKVEYKRPSHQKVLSWMSKHPSGLDDYII